MPTANSYEKLFHKALGGHIDLKSFTREFLTHQGGMPGLAKLLYEQIDLAPDGSMAKAMLLKMAVGLLEKAHDGSASDKALSQIDPSDFAAAFRELAGDAGIMRAIAEGATVPHDWDAQAQ